MTILENKQLLRILTGILIGGLLGFLYYRFVGCSTGACPITRNPVSSIIYGAVMGSLIASSV
ncbi:YtxH domain-containing protein [bacterium]|nr:YtxH domain-containing protein [bacterium]